MSEQFDALVKLSVRDWKFRQALYCAPEEALRMAADAVRKNHRSALACGKKERTYSEWLRLSAIERQIQYRCKGKKKGENKPCGKRQK